MDESNATSEVKPTKTRRASTSVTAISPVVVTGNADVQAFRTNNNLVAPRTKSGSLTFLARKLFYVLIHGAQKGQGKGHGAPNDSPLYKEFFWRPLSQIADDARFNSNDVSQIKRAFGELQSLRIVTEDETEWTAENLIASVKIVNPRGLKKGGAGMTMVGFAFPPGMEQQVLNPAVYTIDSLLYQGQLRKNTSLALYRICKRYETNPSRLTNREAPQYWFNVLSGKPVTEEAPEYRYLKRDTIMPAISEVNAVTDITVELIEHQQGRKINELQFRVQTKKQEQLQLEAPVVDSKLVHRLVALGMTVDEASTYTTNNDESKISATLDLVEQRMQNHKAAKLENPSAYFKKAMNENYASSEAVAKKTVASMPAPRNTADRLQKLREAFIATRVNDAFASFKEMDASEQQSLFEEFKASEAAVGISASKGLKSMVVQKAFSSWYAAKIWPEPPTDSELLMFAADQMESKAG